MVITCQQMFILWTCLLDKIEKLWEKTGFDNLIKDYLILPMFPQNVTAAVGMISILHQTLQYTPLYSCKRI